jgi:hypothetical protein
MSLSPWWRTDHNDVELEISGLLTGTSAREAVSLIPTTRFPASAPRCSDGSQDPSSRWRGHWLPDGVPKAASGARAHGQTQLFSRRAEGPNHACRVPRSRMEARQRQGSRAPASFMDGLHSSSSCSSKMAFQKRANGYIDRPREKGLIEFVETGRGRLARPRTRSAPFLLGATAVFSSAPAVRPMRPGGLPLGLSALRRGCWQKGSCLSRCSRPPNNDSLSRFVSIAYQ